MPMAAVFIAGALRSDAAAAADVAEAIVIVPPPETAFADVTLASDESDLTVSVTPVTTDNVAHNKRPHNSHVLHPMNLLC